MCYFYSWNLIDGWNDHFRLDCNIQMRQWRMEGRSKFVFLFLLFFTFFWGESANAVPNSHKLCSRVPHIWGNRRLQLLLSAMKESRPGGTALLITVSSEPGKYEYTRFVNGMPSSLHLMPSFITFFSRLDYSHFFFFVMTYAIQKIAKSTFHSF